MNLKTSSTIGYERHFNRVLKTIDYGKDIFINHLTADLPLHSPSFDSIIALNRRRPAHDHDRLLETRQAGQVAEFVEAGGAVLDVRDGKLFAGEHLPGSLSVPLAIGQLAGRVPWLITPDQDISVDSLG